MKMPIQIEDYVSPQVRVETDIVGCWPSIEPGIITLYGTGQRDWDIEGVREMLRAGHAMLLVDDNEPGSFMIVTTDEHPYDPRCMEMLIFLCWHKSGTGIERFLPFIEARAREAGMRFVRFYSTRLGMTRLTQGHGYRVHNIEYVKEL